MGSKSELMVYNWGDWIKQLVHGRWRCAFFLRQGIWGLQAIVLDVFPEFKKPVLLVYVDNEEPEECKTMRGKTRPVEIKAMGEPRFDPEHKSKIKL